MAMQPPTDHGGERVSASLTQLALEIEVLQGELARRGRSSVAVDRLAAHVDAIR